MTQMYFQMLSQHRIPVRTSALLQGTTFPYAAGFYFPIYLNVCIYNICVCWVSILKSYFDLESKIWELSTFYDQ